MKREKAVIAKSRDAKEISSDDNQSGLKCNQSGLKVKTGIRAGEEGDWCATAG
jgi:hypothetical protein